MISAATGDGVDALKSRLAMAMPEGPWHFPEDQVSDATDRMLAAEFEKTSWGLDMARKDAGLMLAEASRAGVTW